MRVTRSKPGLVVLAIALGAVTTFAACTETPSDLPECVGPGTYCPDDAGIASGGDGASDASITVDAGSDAGIDAAFDGGLTPDAGQDASPSDAASEDAGNG